MVNDETMKFLQSRENWQRAKTATQRIMEDYDNAVTLLIRLHGVMRWAANCAEKNMDSKIDWDMLIKEVEKAHCFNPRKVDEKYSYG